MMLTQQMAVAAAPDAYIFNHDYADPAHPECKRKIQVNRDGKSFKYSGTAVGDASDPTPRGCSYREVKEYGIRRENFDGKVLPGFKLELGQSGRIGKWEPASSETSVDGIRWNDGDKWTVRDKPLTTVVGEYIFLAYIGFSTLAGVKGAYDAIQRKRAESQ
ncbi:MAG: hypothetical protein SGARI_004349, partial [Bacillariaceae sp.]